MRNGILSGASLGDWLDPPDWLYPSGGDSGSDGGDQSGGNYANVDQPTTNTAPVTCPSGQHYNTVLDTCVPDEAPKQSAGALPKNGASCPKGMIDDPLNPSQFCIIDPKVNTNCPAGQVWDYVGNICCPTGTAYSTATGKCEDFMGTQSVLHSGGANTGITCPYGQVVFGGKCVDVSRIPQPGTPGPQPKPQPKPQPVPPAPIKKAAWYTNPFIIGGILLAGGAAAVAYKKHQDKRKAHEHA